MRLWSKLQYFLRNKIKKQAADSGSQGKYDLPISGNLAADLDYLKKTMGEPEDLCIRGIEYRGQKLALAFLETMSDRDTLHRDILPPLTKLIKERLPRDEASYIELLRANIHTCELKIERHWSKIISSLLDGSAVLLADGQRLALLMAIENWDKRAIEEPKTEAVIRGPREGFGEDLPGNISLIRRRLRTPELRFESITLGRRTNTKVVIAYLEGLALEGVLQELRRRLQRIDIDGVLESNYIEELIEEAPFSPFPQFFRTERPDVVVGEMLQGRIFIIVDGTPFVIGLPGDLFIFLHAPEDYYERWPLIVCLRTFRFIGVIIALLLPSLYVALTTFHHDMIPTRLAISIAAQREAVPYPAFVEALAMQIIFEILIEAGVRLPQVIGPTISIVGALIIGTAAVQAGIISAAMVIVIAATAIASFTITVYGMSQAIRMLRLPMIFAAAAMGLFGIFAGLLAILIHLCSLRNFGLPYLIPLTPFIWQEQKDMLLRVPWWAMHQRPKLIGGKDLRRLKPGLRPSPDPKARPPQDELETRLGQQRSKNSKKKKSRRGYTVR